MRPDRRTRHLAATALTLTAALALALGGGCARSGGRRFLPRVGSLSPDSTLGSDLTQAPAGTTVTPPSLGVDLVRGRAADPTVTRATSPADGVPGLGETRLATW